MKKTLVAVLAFAFVSSAAAQPIPPQAKERAAELVGQMTLDEKIDYIGGYNEFYIRAVPRLGIPEIRMADGPQGVRNNTRSTMFPCGVAAAATWDRALVRDMGRGLGQDAAPAACISCWDPASISTVRPCAAATSSTSARTPIWRRRPPCSISRACSPKGLWRRSNTLRATIRSGTVIR